MSDSVWNKLRHLLVTGYDELAVRLTRRLGSADLAGEAIHEVFLRIERGGELGEVRNPQAYLYRMAANIAADRRAAEALRSHPGEPDTLAAVPDDTPGPDRQTEAAQELELLQAALLELPQRRREIFVAAWLEGLPRAEIARRHGLTKRMIYIELRQALDHCADRLGRPTPRDFTPPPSRPSDE